MIYYDKDKKNPVEAGKFEIDGYGYHIIKEGEFYCFGDVRVRVKGNSEVRAYDNSEVCANDNSRVWAYDNSRLFTYGNVKVWAHDNSKVRAYDNSEVWAHDNSEVFANDNVKVWANDNVKVWANDNSRVIAWDNSEVWAYDNSEVWAYHNVKVWANDNVKVWAYDNSEVKSTPNGFSGAIVIDDPLYSDAKKKYSLDDNINQPQHYKVGDIETIDIIKSKLSEDQFRGFLKGNIIKYITRAGHKDSELEDLKKAQWYLNKLID